VEEESKVTKMDAALSQLDQDFSKEKAEDNSESISQDTYGPFTGQIISCVKNLCRRAFLNADPRIVEGFYLCDL
jgi:ribosome assembly protein 1